MTIDTAGGAGGNVEPVRYPLNIPVKGGNKIKVEGIMLGEDMGDLTMIVQMVFTKAENPGGYVDADIREADIAAVDTVTNLTNIGASAEGSFDVPIEAKTLQTIATMVVPDFGASVVGVRLAAIYNLKGNGLKFGGAYQFAGPGAFFSAVTDGGSGESWGPEMHDVDLAVKGGNVIAGEATVVGEDPGDVTAAIGLLYGGD